MSVPNDRVQFLFSNLHTPSTHQRVGAPAGGLPPVPHHTVDLSSEEPKHDRQKPPKLKRQWPWCCWLVCASWVVGTSLYSVSNIADIDISLPYSAAKVPKPTERDESIFEYITFGVWDSHMVITSLQLQVAVSIALSVRAFDEDISVTRQDDFFFDVKIEHGELHTQRIRKGTSAHTHTQRIRKGKSAHTHVQFISLSSTLLSHSVCDPTES